MNIAAMASIIDNPLLIADISKHKVVGTACAALDPNHIWERFRRYNLKRDKQILPLAALRAFIKGWIPDQQSSYVEQASAIGARPKHSTGHKAQAPGPSRAATRVAPPPPPSIRRAFAPAIPFSIDATSRSIAALMSTRLSVRSLIGK